MDCIFCKIAGKEIPSKTVYEDEDVYAFYDIDPKAPVHVLLIPKKHYGSMLEADEATMGKMMHTAAQLAKTLGLGESGFRLVVNTGSDGGQTVGHLHFHILGGRSLQWPPG